ncbi:MAG: ATP-binding protein [Alkalispirochaeta sp.]
MNVRQRVRYMVLVSIVVLAIGGYGAFWSVQRVNQLRDLQLETQATVARTYQLLVDTSQVSSTAERLQPFFQRWQDSIQATDDGIRTVTEHPALQQVEIDEDGVDSVRIGWENASELFSEATTQLEQILSGEIRGIITPTGIDNMAFQLRQIDSSANTSVQDQELAFIRTLQRRMHNATVSLNYFVTENLQSLVENIETDTQEAVQQTVYFTSTAVALLVVVAMAGLITGTRFLDTANRTLEAHVRERTRSIQSLLDFSGQGFLSFGRDFRIRPEYSRECETIFGEEIAGRDVAEILYDTTQDRQEFRDALRLVFDGTSHPSVVFELLDETVQVGGRTVRLDFRQIDPETVMCSLQDITEQQQLEARISEQNELRETLLAVVEHHSDFTGLMEEAQSVFSSLENAVADGVPDSDGDAFEQLLRRLHTFKANAGFLKLRRTAQTTHELEQSIADSALLSETPPIAEGVAALQAAYDADIAMIEEHLGSDWVSPDQTVIVPRHRIDALRDAIEAAGPATPAVNDRLRELTMVPVGAMESRISTLVRDLARQRGKRAAVVECEVGDVAVDLDVYPVIVDSVTHLVRNMVDHGIERPRQREDSGKPQEGRIRMRAREDGGAIRIDLEDDGAGIDLEAVKRRAVEQNLIETDAEVDAAELVRLIFRDGFSTASSVSAVSGRGEGLPAVRESLHSVRGKLTIGTRRGRGTRFTITIPQPHTERIAV